MIASEEQHSLNSVSGDLDNEVLRHVYISKVHDLQLELEVPSMLSLGRTALLDRRPKLGRPLGPCILVPVELRLVASTSKCAG